MDKVKIFISYSDLDRGLAGEIRRFIEKDERFNCFLAHDDIESGSDWEKAIINNLLESDCILAIHTENFNHSSWCQQEIGMALQSGKVIISLVPDEGGVIPGKGFHAKFQAFSIKCQDLERSIAKLLEADFFRAMTDVSERRKIRAVEFEQLLVEAPDIKIKAEIDSNKSKFLRKIEDHYVSLKNKSDWKDYWQAHLEAIHFAGELFVLADQIIRFKHQYAWEEFLKVFIELHAINEDQDRYGRGGWINHLFYSIFLIIGALAQNYEYLDGLKKLLSLKKLNRDRLENILDWNIQATYLEAKNEAGEPKWYVPRFKYTLDIVEGKDFPIKLKNFKDAIMNFDLFCFIFNLKFSQDGWPWYPCSMYYFEYQTPRFLTLIKQDPETQDLWAKVFFGVSGAQFLTFIKDQVIPKYADLERRSSGFIHGSPFKIFSEKA